MTTRQLRTVSRWARILPALMVCQQIGCLPDDAFSQVLGENIVLTFAIAIQTVTAQVFNSLFGFV